MSPTDSRIGHYEIVRALGHGGMGTVFLANDPTLQRPVAIKQLDTAPDGGESRARVLREARMASALNHPNICTIYEVGNDGGRPFIAMEYIDGQPVSEAGPLPIEDAARHAVEAADALAHAHDRGVVHGDLKAANAIIANTGRLKIVDFGLAHRLDQPPSELTTAVQTTARVVSAGTPYAMAPELVRGEGADALSDIWALGVLLFEMLSGAKPFNAPSVPDLFSAILRDAPAPLPSHVPDVIREIVERCLSKDRGRRYQRAADVRLVLEVAASGLRRRDRTPSGTVVAVGDPLPPPPIVETLSPVDFVGRTGERSARRELGARANGAAPVLLLAGEPGIGKTRLALTFARMCAERGRHHPVGRSDEEALFPYQPFVEALTWYVTVCSQDGSARTWRQRAGGPELASTCAGFSLRRRARSIAPTAMNAEASATGCSRPSPPLLAVVSAVGPRPDDLRRSALGRQTYAADAPPPRALAAASLHLHGWHLSRERVGSPASARRDARRPAARAGRHASLADRPERDAGARPRGRDARP